MAMEKIIVELNKMLYMEFPDHQKLKSLIDLINKKKLVIQIIDFDYYNEARLEDFKLRKNEAVVNKNYELAAHIRDLEVECLSYVEARKKYDVHKSQFADHDGIILYHYLGMALNDHAFTQLFKKMNVRLFGWV